MITKNITCRELTFESAKEIIDYKAQPNDHSYKLIPECLAEIKKLLTDYEELKQIVEEKEKQEAVFETADQILAGLDKMDEDTEICQNALKMNSLLQSEPLKTDVIDDVEDEAEDILTREAPEKLVNNVPEFDFEGELKAKPDEIERLNNLNKDNPNYMDMTK
ncbi:MAG: hypothetical protein J6T10_27530 [Methanobrevibacter sp.]|nr:hypothetical protein [Methanobrevibacter sp.]